LAPSPCSAAPTGWMISRNLNAAAATGLVVVSLLVEEAVEEAAEAVKELPSCCRPCWTVPCSLPIEPSRVLPLQHHLQNKSTITIHKAVTLCLRKFLSCSTIFVLIYCTIFIFIFVC
jgi:hypothetical protein